jgi:hypothetical protein
MNSRITAFTPLVRAIFHVDRKNGSMIVEAKPVTMAMPAAISAIAA